MKRTLLTLLAVLLLIGVASCRRKPVSPAKPKPRPAVAEPQPADGAPEPAAPDKAVLHDYKDVSSDANKVIEKYYPKVSGLNDPAVEAKINASIAAAADMTQEVRMLMEDVDYNPEFTASGEATYNRNGILSVNVFQSFMAEGIPHESYNQVSRTFLLETGDELALADLFAPDSDWAARVDTAVRNHVGQKNIHMLRAYEGIQAPGDKSGFYLTDDGIVVYYQIYDYTSYMDGVLQVTVPWSAVADILAPRLAQPS